jgi:redox-sensing transcriptional repressor
MSGERGDPRLRRIPEATVVRLPVYQRILSDLRRAGVPTVSSERLAALARVNAAKVRKDLSHLGTFGTRGTGYDTAFLGSQIDRALGVGLDWPVAVVGIGNLGRALVNSAGFSSRGFRICALFDVDGDVVGQRVGPVVVRHVDRLAELDATEQPVIGVVATPSEAAQEVTDRLIGIGVRSILNFAPTVLSVPPGVFLRYIDLSIELQVMSFYLSRQRSEDVPDPLAFLRSVGVSAGQGGPALPGP